MKNALVIFLCFTGSALAADAGAPAAQTCKTAADCKGMLPKLCLQCADAGTQCAHWVCTSGHCETLTCEPAAAPAANPPSKEGEPCGDDVAIQRKCAEGLVCQFPTKGPISEHTPGKCVKAPAKK